MTLVDENNIEEVMTYHSPNPSQLHQHEKIQNAAIEFSRVIMTATHPCADQSTALRCVREARMWANAAIALRGMI